LGLALAVSVSPAWAQLALPGNDSKAVLENGTVRILLDPPPDMVTILDLSATPPLVLATVRAPHSWVGSPRSVAITPDERLGLVASARRIDQVNLARTIPDNRLSVIIRVDGGPSGFRTAEH